MSALQMPPLPPPLSVSNARQLEDALARLRAELAVDPLLAVDTESNSMYVYRERVCLVQLSTRASDYIIDPLPKLDLEPLGVLFADASIEKVFHAAEYDLMCLKRDYGFRFTALFDTMVAARICGEKNFGLGALLSEHFGITADKSHQRDDWGRRPLSPDSLQYAQMDTHFLPDLRDYFVGRLTEMDRWEDARETFDQLAEVPAGSRQFDPDGFWRLALPNKLSRRQAAVLRELYLWRDHEASKRDVPPFKVLPDKALIGIAQAAPETQSQLDAIDGLAVSQSRRYGRMLLAAVRRGQQAELPSRPPADDGADPAVLERYAALREWRKQRAQERGVESDVIVSRDALWAIAERAPHNADELGQIRGMGRWRVDQYGSAILDVLARFG